MDENQDVPSAVRATLSVLTESRPMRRGSLSERYMKCNKSGCSCAERPQGRHGPYFSLTRGVAGSTRSRLLSAEQAKLVRRQIESGQQFRRQVEKHWAACEQWANAELEASEAASPGAAEKGGSRRRSRPRSSRRSKHL